jgi:hypothetical protein
MNKKIIRLIIISIMLIVSFITLASCSKENELLEDIIKIDDKVTIIDEKEPEKEEDSEIIESDDLNKAKSKLNGLKYDEELLNNRPIVVVIDNHPKARWQAGISEAEIVYEVEAEAPYTRYLAVFQTKEPERIGPVRSARPYMISLALNYSAIFAHVGGSNDAFAKLKTLSVANMDGLYTSKMWRFNKTKKYAPHNLYTDIKNIREFADSKRYKKDVEYSGFSFNDEDIDIISENIVENIKIIYNKSNTSEYKYDKETKLYTRYKDGEKHLDENNDAVITAKNIIIYTVDRKLLDNEGRLQLGVVGKGTGKYISNGISVDITWSKESENAATIFMLGDVELKLNPGNTWIQVINKNTELIME